jgi:hypothetical protein
MADTVYFIDAKENNKATTVYEVDAPVTSYDIPQGSTSYDVPSPATSYDLPSGATSYDLNTSSPGIDDFKSVSSSVKNSVFMDSKPVLEDLPMDAVDAKENQYAEEFADLWGNSGDILLQFQEQVKKSFQGMNVRVEDIQQVLGNLVLKTRTAQKGSPLIPLFLRASRANKHEVVSEVFDSFVNQAERFAKIIISERQEPSVSRSIPDAHVGGVAGGSKFIAG